MGFLPSNWFTLNIVTLAGSAAIVLFAFALWDRINTINRENSKLQQKEVERAVELSTRLQQIDKLKDDFLAKTSHELRTPLHGVLGIATLVQREGDFSKEQLSEKMGIIASASNRLISLVDDILDFSSIKHNSLQLNITHFDIDDVVSVSIGVLNAIAANKSVALEYHCPAERIAVTADEARTQQILINLIGNAIKFTSRGVVSVEVFKKDSHAHIRVKDSGMGIPEQDLANIFNVFTQGEYALEKQVAGTGIGLALTKQLVEMQQGTIQVQSQVDVGSLFEFTLPLATDKSTENGPKTAPTELDVRYPGAESGALLSKVQRDGFHREEQADFEQEVWAADDDPINLEVISGALSGKYRLRIFSSGDALLTALMKNQKPDLILLDIMMPGKTGFDVCKEVRASFTYYALPVLFLSAKGQIQDKKHGYDLGANDYITKPFSIDELLLRVDYHLKIHKTKRLFDSVHLLSNKIAKAKSLEENLEQLAALLAQELELKIVVAVCEGQCVFESLDSELALPQFLHTEQIHTLANTVDGLGFYMVQSIQPSFVPEASWEHIYQVVHGLWIMVDAESGAYLYLGKCARRQPYSEIEVNYIRSLFDQSLQNLHNVRDIASNPYLTQSVQTINQYLDDLVYIKSTPPYCEVYTACAKAPVTEIRASISNLCLLFQQNEIVKVHRSYAVNPKSVREIKRQERDYRVHCEDAEGHKVELPVSRSNVKKLKQQFPEWF